MSKLYKLCSCGFMNIFEESEAAPRNCAKCTRSIMKIDTFSLDEYEEKQSENAEEKTPVPADEKENEREFLFKLVNTEKNIEILLPANDEFVLGREGVGCEHFGSTISRQHLYVAPTGRLGIRVTDKDSLNGTKVNGELLPKGITKIVVPGNTITLDVYETGITLMLQRVE